MPVTHYLNRAFLSRSPQDVGWLRVKVTPVKQALVTWSSKWVNMFTEHLQSTLVRAEFTLYAGRGNICDKSVTTDDAKHVF